MRSIIYFVIVTLLAFLCAALYIQRPDSLAIIRLKPPISQKFYTKRYVENRDGLVRHRIRADGAERVYWSYDPNEDDQSPRGMLLLLHGSKRSGVSVVEQWKPIADENNVVLIGPDGWNREWDMKNDGEEFMDDLLDHVQDTFKIDQSRIYVFGHSRGAIHALNLAISYSNVFAAVAVHAGSFSSLNDLDKVQRAKRKVPIIFIIGSEDNKFSVKSVKQTAQVFDKQCHETKLFVLDGHNHWYYTLSGYINSLAWDFFVQNEVKYNSSADDIKTECH